MILSLNSPWIPLWLNEGLAEYYAYTRFEEKQIYIGAPSQRFAVLRERTELRGGMNFVAPISKSPEDSRPRR